MVNFISNFGQKPFVWFKFCLKNCIFDAMAEDKRLFLLDGMALIYRAFFAFSQNPRITSKGLNTSAVYGFANTLLDLLNKEKPTHIAVVFDTDKPTERHIEFEAYKAHREEMPEDLAKSIPYVFRLIEGFNIPVITMDGYEADDIIGTLAKKAEIHGYTTFMVTPDKDFGQLVSDHIFIFKPARMGNEMEILGVPEVLKRWDIENVNQVIDILGLMGDAVDNIPGVPGIGEVTAKKLVKQFGSVENLLANTAQLKGKQKENVENFSEQALLSKRLATININVPIDLDEKSLNLDPPNEEVLKELFNELEFRTLMKRIFGEVITGNSVSSSGQVSLFGEGSGQSAASKEQSSSRKEIVEEVEVKDFNTINNVPHHYECVDSEEKINELVNLLINAIEICFDTETTDIDPINAELVGMSFSIAPGEAYYIPMPESRDECLKILNHFKVIFEHETIVKIGQNIKYDLLVLRNYGIEIKGPLFDTMLAHYLIEPDQRHGMDAMAEVYLNYSPISISTLIGKKGAGQLNMRNVPVEKVVDYAAEDADITLQLKKKLEPNLLDESLKVFQEIEIPLLRVLADMESEGVRIDKDFLNNYSKDLEDELAILEKDIFALAGISFNISSPKQLGEVLFEKLKLDPKAKKTKTGQYQTGEDILSELASKHDIAKKIIEFRQLQKLKSTYVDALPELINKKTGRVHTSFNQAVAATGRLSSTNPNLQNIPIRTDKGKEVRKAFIPENGNVLLSADYSQIELRLIAAISKEEGMIEDFKKGLDIHTATAAKVFGVPLEEVDKDMRRKAKMVNFGIIYGISAFGLAQRLEIPRKEAAEIIENYFKQYPGIKRYMNDTIDNARMNGYVETVMGRRRYTRDINSNNQTVRGFAERNAINAPIQGSAADLIKLAMIKIHQRMKEENFKSKMILQVHDELLFDVVPDELDTLKKLVIHEMESAIKLDVPILVEAGSGNNWLEAH